ncbi:MAG TPA: BREX-3 system P-loop-containing protein BrxF [Thermoanaerobacterales bacterium]|nr:BREX-3 system P-loop-containing protein BrxF [Thermoanaerobacterales bacterium]
MDNTEILFEKHLKLDPIGTLKNISRYKKIIASTRGIIKDDCLVYARPGEELGCRGFDGDRKGILRRDI